MTAAQSLAYIAANYDLMAWEAEREPEHSRLRARANHFYRMAKLSADAELAVPYHYQEA